MLAHPGGHGAGRVRAVRLAAPRSSGRAGADGGRRGGIGSPSGRRGDRDAVVRLGVGVAVPCGVASGGHLFRVRVLLRHLRHVLHPIPGRRGGVLGAGGRPALAGDRPGVGRQRLHLGRHLGSLGAASRPDGRVRAAGGRISGVWGNPRRGGGLSVGRPVCRHRLECPRPDGRIGRRPVRRTAGAGGHRVDDGRHEPGASVRPVSRGAHRGRGALFRAGLSDRRVRGAGAGRGGRGPSARRRGDRIPGCGASRAREGAGDGGMRRDRKEGTP